MLWDDGWHDKHYVLRIRTFKTVELCIIAPSSGKHFTTIQQANMRGRRTGKEWMHSLTSKNTSLHCWFFSSVHYISTLTVTAGEHQCISPFIIPMLLAAEILGNGIEDDATRMTPFHPLLQTSWTSFWKGSSSSHSRTPCLNASIAAAYWFVRIYSEGLAWVDDGVKLSETTQTLPVKILTDR